MVAVEVRPPQIRPQSRGHQNHQAVRFAGRKAKAAPKQKNDQCRLIVVPLLRNVGDPSMMRKALKIENQQTETGEASDPGTEARGTGGGLGLVTGSLTIASVFERTGEFKVSRTGTNQDSSENENF